MTIDDLASYLQVAKSTLYKLAQEGKVPGQKVGKHWRFSREAVDAWLRAEPQSKRKNEPDDSDSGGGDAR
ncbi:MAG: helix-turn-helix domain-containing protein [Phycisphaerales bacterium JB040]